MKTAHRCGDKETKREGDGERASDCGRKAGGSEVGESAMRSVHPAGQAGV